MFPAQDAQDKPAKDVSRGHQPGSAAAAVAPRSRSGAAAEARRATESAAAAAAAVSAATLPPDPRAMAPTDKMKQAPTRDRPASGPAGTEQRAAPALSAPAARGKAAHQPALGAHLPSRST
jgi:hypothetical protein